MAYTVPPVSERAIGLEVLAFHRGKWVHVKWNPDYGWSLGYGAPFIRDGSRAFAPLPEKPADAAGFYDFA